MEEMPENCFAAISRESEGILAQLLLPGGNKKIKRFPETELRSERRLTLSWLESLGRKNWGRQWRSLKKSYETYF